MPEIDTDLFQVIALGLLFLTLLTLLAALSVLSGIKKQLESGRGPQAAAPPPSTSYEYQAPAAAYDPAPAYLAPQAQPTQEVSTGFVSMTEAAPTATATQTAVGAAATGLRGDEPEEQPFERDGRWWFKRGGELLVYDEGTGQWVASPAGPGATVAPSAASLGDTTTAVASSEVGEGWKCSSCGAVNGSTATSCRMCFAPR